MSKARSRTTSNRNGPDEEFVDLNDKLAQWEAQQREAKAKAKGDKIRERTERAKQRRKSMEARTVSFDESMSTTSSKKSLPQGVRGRLPRLLII